MDDRIGTCAFGLFVLTMLIGCPEDSFAGTTTRVSVNSAGEESVGDINGNGLNQDSDISGNGRFAALTSFSDLLSLQDGSNQIDTFIHDRKTGETVLASLNSDGEQANLGASLLPSLSANGRFLTFSSSSTNLIDNDNNGDRDIFVRDLKRSVATRISVKSDGSEATNFSFGPAISANGRLVAFGSFAPNIVNGDNNDRSDIFVHDRR